MLDHVREIAVRRRHYANVDLDGAGTSQSLKFLFLEDPQQFRLQFERNISDFIEEKRALMRQFEAADLPRNRPGECAFLMAEQFTFQQASRNGGAIHFDKGVLAARTELMERARDEFLPCSRFPSDQDG